MKFIEPRPFADPEVAARKLIELANAFEPVQDGRIYIECCLIPRREYSNETAPAHWGAGGWGRQGSTDRGDVGKQKRKHQPQHRRSRSGVLNSRKRVS